MIGKDRLAQVVSDNDALADEGHSVPDILRRRGVLDAAASYVAEQRAMRVYAVAQHGDGGRDPLVVEFAWVNAHETLRALLTTIWIDGLAAGLAAAEAERETV